MIVLSTMFREQDESSTGKNQDVKRARGGGWVTRMGSFTTRDNLI
jgi:hypothetical protein